MSGIRDHKVFIILYGYFPQIRESDMGGGSDFVGYSTELLRQEWVSIAPKKEYAIDQLKHRYGMLKGFVVDEQSIKEYPIDAFLYDIPY